MTVSTNTIISAAELHQRLGSNNLCIVDLRTNEAFEAGHIPGARVLTPGRLNGSAPPVGGLLPSQQEVNEIAKTIGLGSGQTLVAYDHGAETAAARLVWVFHAFGYTPTLWLDGGFPAWQTLSFPISQEIPPADVEAVQLQHAGDNVIHTEELISRIDDPALAILDVRSRGEFDGTDVRAERGGHIPGAQHMEWTEVFDKDGMLRDRKSLQSEFTALGITPDKEVIVYCQTHQRSAVTYALLKDMGYDNVRALDGAWSDWGNRTDTPIES